MATTLNHNVGFKLGKQSAVDTMLAKGANAGAVAGSFYLTSDTHRLYIGNADTSLSPVNEGVTTVTTLNDLPTISKENAAAYVGRFYYVSGTPTNPVNILCVFNGKGWAQINTDTTVQSIEFTVAEQTANRAVLLHQLLTNWDGAKMTTQVEDQISFKGQNGIFITKATDGDGNPQVVIEGDTYTLSSGGSKNAAEIKLDSTKESNDSKVTLVPGSFPGESDVNVEIEQNNNVITIKAKDTSNSSLDIVAQDEDAGGGFKVSVYDSHGADVTDTINPTIAYGRNGNKSANFKSGISTLEVYSMAEIDETLRVLNAMTYRGTIGATGTVASDITMLGANKNNGCTVKYNGTALDVSIGDTFLVVGNTVKYNSDTLSANTLLIARSTDGTENAQGIIPNNKLIFDVVASTIDIDTTYRIETASVADGSAAKFYLYDERTFKEAGGLTLQTVRSDDSKKSTGLKLTRTTTTTPADGHTDVWTIEHDKTKAFDPTDGGKYTRAASTLNGLPVQQYTATVVTDIETNDTGHVTGFTLKEMPIQDTNSIIEKIEKSTSVYSAAGKQFGIIGSKTTELLNNSNTRETLDNVAFVSESLQIKTSGNVAIASGSTTVAAGLQIDMVWGTFE